MDANSSTEQKFSGVKELDGTAASSRLLRADWRQLLSWKRSRTAIAGIAAAAALAVILSLSGMLTASVVPWWDMGIVAVGSLLLGLVVSSYIRAPIGAGATFCDTRWPILGLAALVIATSTGHGTLAAQLFPSASPGVLAGLIQPAFALLAFALLGWALRERLSLERKALEATADGDTVDLCTDCRPLFPTKPAP